jgi:hypothetical protein
MSDYAFRGHGVFPHPAPVRLAAQPTVAVEFGEPGRLWCRSGLRLIGSGIMMHR